MLRPPSVTSITAAIFSSRLNSLLRPILCGLLLCWSCRGSLQKRPSRVHRLTRSGRIYSTVVLTTGPLGAVFWSMGQPAAALDCTGFQPNRPKPVVKTLSRHKTVLSCRMLGLCPSLRFCFVPALYHTFRLSAVSGPGKLNIEATWGRDIMEERGLTYLVDILQGLSQNDPLKSF